MSGYTDEEYHQEVARQEGRLDSDCRADFSRANRIRAGLEDQALLQRARDRGLISSSGSRSHQTESREETQNKKSYDEVFEEHVLALFKLVQEEVAAVRAKHDKSLCVKVRSSGRYQPLQWMDRHGRVVVEALGPIEDSQRLIERLTRKANDLFTSDIQPAFSWREKHDHVNRVMTALMVVQRYGQRVPGEFSDWHPGCYLFDKPAYHPAP